MKRRRRLGSDAEDVAAIQAYLGKLSSQVSAAVESLDQATKDKWYPLAKRIVAMVSADASSITLAAATALRNEFNAFLGTLPKDAQTAVTHAPDPVRAPPPKGTPGPLAFLEELPPLLVVVALLLLAREMKR